LSDPGVGFIGLAAPSVPAPPTGEEPSAAPASAVAVASASAPATSTSYKEVRSVLSMLKRPVLV